MTYNMSVGTGAASHNYNIITYNFSNTIEEDWD